MARFEDVADEYRIAYQQLKHHEKQAEELVKQMEREGALTWKRYQMARAAFVELALGSGEKDDFLDGEAQ
jgi:hypothetical protein